MVIFCLSIALRNTITVLNQLTKTKTLFLKEGEVYNKITIKEIGKKKVSVVDADNTKEVSLQ